jgi:hypothetical protein
MRQQLRQLRAAPRCCHRRLLELRSDRSRRRRAGTYPKAAGSNSAEPNSDRSAVPKWPGDYRSSVVGGAGLARAVPRCTGMGFADREPPLHTREVAGSIPAAPMTEGLQRADFSSAWSSVDAARYGFGKVIGKFNRRRLTRTGQGRELLMEAKPHNSLPKSGLISRRSAVRSRHRPSESTCYWVLSAGITRSMRLALGWFGKLLAS